MVIRWIGLAALAATASLSLSQQGGGGKDIRPLPPEYAVYSKEFHGHLDRAEALLKERRLDEAIPHLEKAFETERRLTPYPARARYMLAKALDQAGRWEEALEAYRHIFHWDSRRNSLEMDLGDPVHPIMEYAILLGKVGRSEDAKTVYHYGLHHLNPDGRRYREPVPMLVVFAPEEEGTPWEYTPERLEAAARMAKFMDGTDRDGPRNETLKRIEKLAPDWFYPMMWRAASRWRHEEGPRYLAQAEALAKPGLERDFIAKYRTELEQHKMEVVPKYPYAPDERPMMEGASRRKRMDCLRLDPADLKRLSFDKEAALATSPLRSRSSADGEEPPQDVPVPQHGTGGAAPNGR